MFFVRHVAQTLLFTFKLKKGASMKSRTYTTMAALVVFFTVFVTVFDSHAAEISASHEYAPLQWNYQGASIPETYYTPWLPLGAQTLTRYKIGFRLSTGTIGVKCPVKLTFTYDSANAKSSKDLTIKVKAELMPADYKTFESAFGLYLPNEFQIGFVGITGVPDILPWYTLPWDICEILGKVPLPDAASAKVTAVCALIANLGVNTGGKSALPLPGPAEYHDMRTLLDLNFTDFFTDQQKTQYMNDLGICIFNKLSSALGSFDMGNILLMIQVAKGVDEAGATEFLTDQCIAAAGKLTSLANITVKGDPFFKVEGVELSVDLRAYIPNGGGSGTWPLVFTASGQEKSFTFRDITPFIKNGDKLIVTADNISYRFKLRQGIVPNVQFSVIPAANLNPYEKYIDLGTAKRSFSESDYKLEIPLKINNDIVQGLRVNAGCTSMSVNWASPLMPLKGTVKAFDGQNLITTVSESSFKLAHNVIVPGLTMAKQYQFKVECLNEQGQQIPAGEITGTTISGNAATGTCPSRVENTTAGNLSMSNQSAQAGVDWIELNWQTNRNASTEAFVSPSPDISVNYIASIKKQSGEVVTGWAGGRGGAREFVTNHVIRVIGLEPGTVYYYNMRSWTFTDDNDTKDPQNRVGTMGQIATLAAPQPPTVKVKVIHQAGQTVADVPVEVTKSGAGSSVSYVTGADGFTNPIILSAGATYNFAVKNQGCYPDALAPSLTVPSTAVGSLTSTEITLTDKTPNGAYVRNAQGQPVSGAAVSSGGRQAATDANGYYSFGTWLPATVQTITISKPDFITKQIAGSITPCGKSRSFTIPDCILQSGVANINITVKNKSGGAVSNAQIRVKEGNGNPGFNLTDAQGKFTWTNDFTENTQTHNLTITATPTAATGLSSSVTQISIFGGTTQNVELVCLSLPPPTIKVKVVYQSGPVAAVPVLVTKSGTNTSVSYTTGANGFTPSIPLMAGGTYTFVVKNQSCYPDAAAPSLTVPATTITGELTSTQITFLDKTPNGANVHDAQGKPVSGVLVSGGGKQATTDAGGHFSFGAWVPTASVSFTVSKTGFITKQVTGTVSPCGKSKSFTIPDCVLPSSMATINVYVVNAEKQPIGSAVVTVKEGAAALGAAVTANANGLAVWSHDLGANTNAHNLKVTATSPSEVNPVVGEIPVTIAAGGEEKETITCLPDTKAPEISGVVFSQVDRSTIKVNFNANEAISSACLEYMSPGSKKSESTKSEDSGLRSKEPKELESTGWVELKSGNLELTLHEKKLPAGMYKIRIKAKDRSGNSGQTDLQDFKFFDGELWNLKVSVSDGKATVSWTQYPDGEYFEKYVLTLVSGAEEATSDTQAAAKDAEKQPDIVKPELKAESGARAAAKDIEKGPDVSDGVVSAPETKSIEIQEVSKTSYIFKDIDAGKNHQFKIIAISQKGTVLAESKTVAFSTKQ
jgi:hypothetical protein